MRMRLLVPLSSPRLISYFDYINAMYEWYSTLCGAFIIPLLLTCASSFRLGMRP